MDALHVAAALLLKADELITTGKLPLITCDQKILNYPHIKTLW
jgi:hypothetical protein